MLVSRSAALLVIDVQKAIDHPSWGERNNPQAESNIAALLAAWRASGRPIYHVRHDSTELQSHYRPGQSGHENQSRLQRTKLFHQMREMQILETRDMLW